jgi:hypothetical protein
VTVEKLLDMHQFFVVLHIKKSKAIPVIGRGGL